MDACLLLTKANAPMYLMENLLNQQSESIKKTSIERSWMDAICTRKLAVIASPSIDRNLKLEFLHQLRLMTWNPPVKYEHVIHWMLNADGGNSSRTSFPVAPFSQLYFCERTAWICWRFFFISSRSSKKSKNSNKAGRSIRIVVGRKAYEKMTERFISYLSQPAFIPPTSAKRFFLRIPLHASEIKMKNWGWRWGAYESRHSETKRSHSAKWHSQPAWSDAKTESNLDIWKAFGLTAVKLINVRLLRGRRIVWVREELSAILWTTSSWIFHDASEV